MASSALLSSPDNLEGQDLIQFCMRKEQYSSLQKCLKNGKLCFPFIHQPCELCHMITHIDRERISSSLFHLQCYHSTHKTDTEEAVPHSTTPSTSHQARISKVLKEEEEVHLTHLHRTTNDNATGLHRRGRQVISKDAREVPWKHLHTTFLSSNCHLGPTMGLFLIKRDISTPLNISNHSNGDL